MNLRLPARIGAFACLGVALAMGLLALREEPKPSPPPAENRRRFLGQRPTPPNEAALGDAPGKTSEPARVTDDVAPSQQEQ